MVGVDVFHAPMVYDPTTGKKVRKASCAAIIVQIVRGGEVATKKIEIYSKTFRREGGNEYDLGEGLKETIAEALSLLKVAPKSAVVWRDGIADSADHHADEEIAGIRQGLSGGNTAVGIKEGKPSVPLAYITCQKRISTKLLTTDGKYAAPSGTMVTSLQGLQNQTFYINGRAPPYSTSKPVRFICVVRDQKLNTVPMGELTWQMCHDYPNWTGPIKGKFSSIFSRHECVQYLAANTNRLFLFLTVPSVCQMAHKLAELAGGFNDGGESIDAEAYTNRVYFL